MASRRPTTISLALLINASIPPRAVAIFSIVELTGWSSLTSICQVVTGGAVREKIPSRFFEFFLISGQDRDPCFRLY
jgi:hypothetical protein